MSVKQVLKILPYHFIWSILMCVNGTAVQFLSNYYLQCTITVAIQVQGQQDYVKNSTGHRK